ncbi:hypothetical protein CRG98_006962 [Punica granatum]|uniref:Uncharacterized protein n=1 Tax=Punica granatum TaxID=22663 RepID=A0A2I0KVU2_PUNGR|nr:hypothetical protein CRG98_006962 [Punica granatum]
MTWHVLIGPIWFGSGCWVPSIIGSVRVWVSSSSPNSLPSSKPYRGYSPPRNAESPLQTADHGQIFLVFVFSSLSDSTDIISPNSDEP